MLKYLIIFVVIESVSFAAKCQNKPKYHAFINFATSPGFLGFNGRLFEFNNDSLLVMVRKGYKIGYKKYKKTVKKKYIDTYDTTRYILAKDEEDTIQKTINSIDSLASRFNFCIIDGLRFYFTCGIDKVSHGAWISNAYDPKIFLFIDILNKHVPEKLQVRYDREWLIKFEKQCLKERFGIND